MHISSHTMRTASKSIRIPGFACSIVRIDRTDEVFVYGHHVYIQIPMRIQIRFHDMRTVSE